VGIDVGLAELRGVTLIGIPPIGVVHVELNPGLTALYGLNGAGKTRILEGIRCALTGRRPEHGIALLHLAVEDDVYLRSDAPRSWLDHFQSQLRESVDKARGMAVATLATTRDRGFGDGDDAVVDSAVEAMREFTDAISDEEFSPSTPGELVWARVAVAAAADGPTDTERDVLVEVRERATSGERVVFTMTAIGVEHPEWQIHAATTADAGSTHTWFRDDVRWLASMREMVEKKRTEMTPHQYGSFVAMLDEPYSSNRIRWAALGGLSPADVTNYLGRAAEPSSLHWPRWAGLPVVPMGSIAAAPIRVVDAIGPIEHARLNIETLDLLSAGSSNLVTALLDDEVAFSDDLNDALARITAEARRLTSEVLASAPEPMFLLGHPNGWVRGDLPRWTARVQGHSVELDRLSAAELRWVTAGIAMATAGHAGDQATILLCDEPEHGLHRRAEMNLAKALHAVSIEAGVPTIVATHSPGLVNDTRVSTTHVTRDPSSGRTSATTMSPVTRSALERDQWMTELGLTPSDLFQMTRVFVCVEGPHDRIVVENLLGDDLDAGAGVCVHIGGAKQAVSIIDASLLLGFSDARVILVLDNLENARLQPLWRRIQSAETDKDHRELSRALIELERFGSGEAKWLRDLADDASKRGQINRISVFGLRKPDVICYLPPEHFVPGADNWDRLTEPWRRQRDPRDLKGWLKTNRGAKINKTLIEAAVESMQRSLTAIDPDLVELGLRIREHGATPAL
jgi:hypothetical protein